MQAKGNTVIGRIIIILVALQLFMTSAFSHVMPMAEHCAEPMAQHIQCAEPFDLQVQSADVAVDPEQDTKSSGLVHCTSNICTEQLTSPVPALQRILRSAELDPSEPQMALQSVFLSQLRPPSV